MCQYEVFGLAFLKYKTSQHYLMMKKVNSAEAAILYSY